MLIPTERSPKTRAMYKAKKLDKSTIALTIMSQLPHLLRFVALKYESTPFFKWSKNGVPAVLNLIVLNVLGFTMSR
jgi:hypothetical protein